jgi:hypothetical protein
MRTTVGGNTYHILVANVLQSKSCPVCRKPFLSTPESADSDVSTESNGFGLLATEEEMLDLLRRVQGDDAMDEQYRTAGPETYGMYS